MRESRFEVICPWCGHVYDITDYWDCDLGKYNETCEECGKPFVLRVEPIYVTEKPESMCQEGE